MTKKTRRKPANDNVKPLTEQLSITINRVFNSPVNGETVIEAGYQTGNFEIKAVTTINNVEGVIGELMFMNDKIKTMLGL